jgi:hypothetical protein
VAGFDVPDSVGQLRGLFEMVVTWGDRSLADDRDAAERPVLAGYGLGAQRAEALGRQMRSIDVEYGLALLCKWPFKPEVSPALLEEIDRARDNIIPVASEGLRVDIDPSLLTSSLDDLYERLGTDGPPLAGM